MHLPIFRILFWLELIIFAVNFVVTLVWLVFVTVVRPIVVSVTVAVFVFLNLRDWVISARVEDLDILQHYYCPWWVGIFPIGG